MTLGYALARRLTAPPRPRRHRLTVLPSAPGFLTVPATESTTQAGEWGVFLDSGAHLRVSGEPRRNGRTVTWRIDERCGPLEEGRRAAWSGIVAVDPVSAGRTCVDHPVPTRAGAAPTWFFDSAPGDEHPVWAVHIFGLGSTRSGMLRSVDIASHEGIPSVVPAYRNTLEGPTVGRGRSHLGATEVDDVADVLGALSVTGEERFVLFGWSMGAQIALQLADSAAWAPRIDRLVLDSPVLDWRSVLEANAARAKISPRLARLAIPWLEGRHRARAVGLSSPVDLDRLDWVRRAERITQPVLVHHGSRDWSVPLGDSRAFAERAPRATLVPSAGGHTTGWNAGPADYIASTVRFLGANDV